MTIKYNVIKIFTGEETRWQGKSIANAIIDKVSKAKIAGRCLVCKGIAGCNENGELANQSLEILSYNMPLKIEIVLPATELDAILPDITEMIDDGIVAVEDIRIHSYKSKGGLIPRHLKVKDVMTNSPVSVSPDQSMADILKIILTAPFNALPVTDAKHIPIGIITERDLIDKGGLPVRLGLLKSMNQGNVEDWIQSFSNKRTAELMSAPLILVQQNNELTFAVELMVKKNLKRLPVINQEGKLCGILSRIDIFKTIFNKTPDWQALVAQNVNLSNIRFVKDVIIRETHAVNLDTPLRDIVRLLRSKSVQRLAVVDNEQRLAGMIFDKEILKFFAPHQSGVWELFTAKLPFFKLLYKNRPLLKFSHAKTAADLMNTQIIRITENSSIEEAIKIMAEKGIKRLPVVNENGIFLGTISRNALLKTGLFNL